MANLFGASLSLVLVVAGVALCIAEAFAPGAHFVVIGVALLAAGLVGVLLPGIATPIVLAVLVFVVGALALWGYRNLELYEGSGRGKTEGSTSLRGAHAVVTERVTSAAGQVRLTEGGGFDPTYAARTLDGADPIEEGADVVVVDPGGGNVLTVAETDGADDIDRELAAGRERAEAESEAETEGEEERA
ncbi:putative activity regulator of membrane protease YbbK [Halarchaeum acidiphilum MH1-52-1]|uniref:Putative activity regulator of membrane protease YbbK n=1 Tax=Halarchaeum acidiphilum MH1-52-1 TaxID=1261545 RepID=U3A8F2_9EURY|nr:NfeD family protein [Halarchaeum acidiphilum]GAD53939.1 putative activity regulator of membrane protease YbbK [Halarchaeum acidiphilum MH1-52-1]